MTYIIGDVHGCFYTLKSLIKKLPNDAKIIFTGDLCDKGNFTKEVLDFIIENNYEVILGNHDEMMIQYLEKSIFHNLSNIWNTSDVYGGNKTVKSYSEHHQVLDKHLSFLKEIAHYKIIDNYFITHGFGLPYYKSRDKKDTKRKILSNRLHKKYPDWERKYWKYNIINIFGHCDFEEVEIGKNYFGIDTSCVYGGKLTAFELYTHNIISEPLNIKDIS